MSYWKKMFKNSDENNYQYKKIIQILMSIIYLYNIKHKQKGKCHGTKTYI